MISRTIFVRKSINLEQKGNFNLIKKTFILNINCLVLIFHTKHNMVLSPNVLGKGNKQVIANNDEVSLALKKNKGKVLLSL